MRRAMIAVLLVVTLLALDAIFNSWRFSQAVYLEVQEFGRLVNRTLQGGF